MEYTKFFIQLNERRMLPFLSVQQLDTWIMLIFLEGKMEAMLQSQFLINNECRTVRKEIIENLRQETLKYTRGKTPERMLAEMLPKDIAG